MKFLSMVLTLVFTINGYASSGLASSFKDALDQYQYELTVEWDQKNQNSLEEINTNFSSQLDNMFQAGLNSNHIREAIKGNSEFEIPANMNRSETLEWIKDNSQDFYRRGASWDSTAVILYGGLGALVVGFISYSIWYSNNYECAGWVPAGPQNTCTEWVRK